jgi:hypothetical protein
MSLSRLLSSDFDLLRYTKSVIYLDTETTDRVLYFRVSEEKLYSPKVAGLAINLRGFCPAHEMSAIHHAVQTSGL